MNYMSVLSMKNQILQSNMKMQCIMDFEIILLIFLLKYALNVFHI